MFWRFLSSFQEPSFVLFLRELDSLFTVATVPCNHSHCKHWRSQAWRRHTVRMVMAPFWLFSLLPVHSESLSVCLQNLATRVLVHFQKGFPTKCGSLAFLTLRYPFYIFLFEHGLWSIILQVGRLVVISSRISSGIRGQKAPRWRWNHIHSRLKFSATTG